MSHLFNSFAIGYFDILGFERRLYDEGLYAMLQKYLRLAEVVESTNRFSSFDGQQMPEGVMWTADRKTYLNSRVFGAYASDSILLWSPKHFPEGRYPAALSLSQEELRDRASDPKGGWRYWPVPPDRFLDTCNELICLGLELGLPLRGAVAMGEAALSAEASLYLGVPMVEAARIEASQRFVGASFANSFMQQVVPNRYMLPYTGHIKAGFVLPNFSGQVLDWPRHWRKTRGTSVASLISSMSHAEHSDLYENTLAVVQLSDCRETSTDADEEQHLDRLYPQFRDPEVELHVTYVKSVDA
jgi:hypothetical protein